MRDDATGVCAVSIDGAILLGNQMNMSCSSGIMSRENGVEITNTIAIYLGYTTKEGSVLRLSICGQIVIRLQKTHEIAGVRIVTVTGSDNTAVNSGAVCLPRFQIKSCSRLACAGVDILILQVDRYASLRFNDVGTIVFSDDEVRADNYLRREDARGVLVVGKQDRWSSRVGIAKRGQVVVNLLEGFKRGKVTSGLEWGFVFGQC